MALSLDILNIQDIPKTPDILDYLDNLAKCKEVFQILRSLISF